MPSTRDSSGDSARLPQAYSYRYVPQLALVLSSISAQASWALPSRLQVSMSLPFGHSGRHSGSFCHLPATVPASALFRAEQHMVFDFHWPVGTSAIADQEAACD